jgi:hypothetical protein
MLIACQSAVSMKAKVVFSLGGSQAIYYCYGDICISNALSAALVIRLWGGVGPLDQYNIDNIVLIKKSF